MGKSTGANQVTYGSYGAKDKMHPFGNYDKPMDLLGLAQQQSAEGKQNVNQQTWANRPDINTSFGSQNWSQGADGRWQMNSQLNPQMQGLQAGFTSQLSGATGADANKRAFDTAYGQETSRLDPQWNQRQSQEQSQLAAQGLDSGSQAYQTSMGDFNRGRNDAYQSAYNNASQLGNQAQQMNFMQGMGGLQGLQGLMQMPGFNGAGLAPTTPYLNVANEYLDRSNDRINAQNGQTNDAVGSWGKFAGSLVGASDERIKEDIHRLPVEVVPGVPVATFRFKGDPTHKTHTGVIAQDLEKVDPSKVMTGPDGIKRVDYGALTAGGHMPSNFMGQGFGPQQPQVQQPSGPSGPYGAGAPPSPGQFSMADVLRQMSPEQASAFSNASMIDPQNEMARNQSAQIEALRAHRPNPSPAGSAFLAFGDIANSGTQALNLYKQKSAHDALIQALRSGPRKPQSPDETPEMTSMQAPQPF